MVIDEVTEKVLPDFAGGLLENTIEDIFIRNSYLKNSKVKIRHSYIPLSSSIIAKVECGECNNKYKKKLFYQRIHYFVADIELG